MSQTVDPLHGWLDDGYRRALGEWFLRYEIEIISCVMWRNRAPWKIPRRQCFDSFLLFPTRGKFRVKLDSGRHLVAPGQYLALPDSEWHEIEIEKGCTRLEQLSLHCRMQDRWRRPLLARFPAQVARLDHAPFWHRALTDLAFLMRFDPEVGQSRGKVLVRELLAERLRMEKKWPPLEIAGDPRIERVLRRMREDHSSLLLSVEGLSREVELTSTQMRKLFRRETGAGPHHYLQKLRLERAAYLLHHSTQSIKQVALQSGFATDNYFHLVFRKAFGLTPVAYRNKEVV
jgi:AraC-like DNA-binding protein